MRRCFMAAWFIAFVIASSGWKPLIHQSLAEDDFEKTVDPGGFSSEGEESDAGEKAETYSEEGGLQVNESQPSMAVDPEKIQTPSEIFSVSLDSSPSAQKNNSQSANEPAAVSDELTEEEEFLLEPEIEEETLPDEASPQKKETGSGDKQTETSAPQNPALEKRTPDALKDSENSWEEIPSAESERPGAKLETATRTVAQIPTVLTNLEDCKRVAQLNDRRVQVALKEIEFQRYKLLEAERVFLPQIKANWERQTGESAQDKSDQAFTGLKYGLESQQVLFNGGKLVYGLKQAKTNLETAKKKYEQARQEAIYKVEKSYYELVKAQMAFEIQADLSKAAESALSFSREAYRQGLNAYHEFLNIQGQTDQTYYQLLSSQQDIALGELSLRQACNVDGTVGIQINAVLTFSDFEFNYSLDECLELGLKNRPDLAVNELTVLSDLYNIKLAKAEGLPKIEFLGTIGKNGQSKSGENLDLTDEFSVKLQASWVMGANAAQYSWENKKSAPKDFGVADNTKQSKTQSASLGLFDKLDNFSNLAKAHVQKATSEADLTELHGKVASEVEENYFNYQKAMTMVTASLSKIKFREKDLEVNRAKQMMNEVPLSQVLTAELALGEERINYVKALSDYYTSISGLFKAMGLSK